MVATIMGMKRTILLPAFTALLVAIGSPSPAMAPPLSVQGSGRQDALPPLPSPRPIAPISLKDLRCLTLNVYHESRGEPREGQIAVAKVTLNRAAHADFPVSLCDVVHQGREHNLCQFGWACTPAAHTIPDTNDMAWRNAETAALQALTSPHDPTHGALYFQAKGTLPAWAAHAISRITIGNHVFFRL